MKIQISTYIKTFVDEDNTIVFSGENDERIAVIGPDEFSPALARLAAEGYTIEVLEIVLRMRELHAKELRSALAHFKGECP